MDFYELKRVFEEFDPRNMEEISDDLLEYVFDDIKTPQGLMYLTLRANSLLKDFLGLNEDNKVMSIDEIGKKNESTNMSIYENVKNSIMNACFKMHCATWLCKEDPSVSVIDYYKAMSLLSTRTMNLMFRFFVFNLENFMGLDAESMKKIRSLGNTGALEIKNAQEVIKNAPRKEIEVELEETVEEFDEDIKIYVPKKEADSTKVYPSVETLSYEKRQLLMNKLLILLNEKQNLDNEKQNLDFEFSKIDYEIKKILGEIEEELNHGIRR